MKLTKKVIIPVAIAVVLLLAYVGGMVYYSDKYLPGTIINGRDFSGKVPAEAENILLIPATESITILGQSGVKEVLELSEGHYTGTIDTEKLETIQSSQHKFTWFLEFFTKAEYTVSNEFEFNKEELSKTIHSLGIVSSDRIIPSEDAYISEIGENFLIVPEVLGNEIDLNIFQPAVITAISSGKDTLDLEKSECYKRPKVVSTAPELVEPLEKLNAIGNITITYDFADRTEVLNYEGFSPWVQFSGAKGLEINREKARNYIVMLAQKYDTYYTNRRFNATGIGEITVGGGIYGWQTDVDTSTDQLIEALLLGKSQTIEPAYSIRGLTRKTYDIGNTYIEIDLTRQHMWLYVNGVLQVETGIVSGLPGGARETPTGIGSVWSKEEKRFITADGSDFWVEYWMPITWTGVGIHDAPWQPTFGGTRYLVGGSHGCINTPYEKVSAIYHAVELYTPVVMYKS